MESQTFFSSVLIDSSIKSDILFPWNLRRACLGMAFMGDVQIRNQSHYGTLQKSLCHTNSFPSMCSWIKCWAESGRKMTFIKDKDLWVIARP